MTIIYMDEDLRLVEPATRTNVMIGMVVLRREDWRRDRLPIGSTYLEFSRTECVIDLSFKALLTFLVGVQLAW
jgi:hypothetical protein